MGREVRRVPPDWQHPKDARGRYEPMMDITHAEALATWHPDDGDAPGPDYYRPEWPEGSATAYQLYETVSEGTPVSPVFVTREELIDYLVNDGRGMGIGGTVQRMSPEAAARFADAGWAPSAVGLTGVGLAAGITMFEQATSNDRGTPAPASSKEGGRHG